MKRVLCLLFCLIFLLQGCAFISKEPLSDKDLKSETTQNINSDTLAEGTLKEQIQELLKTTNSSQEENVSQTVTESPNYPQTGYYYTKLSEDEQSIYQQIYHSITERIEIKVSTLEQEVVDKIFHCVLHDHPELFYISGYKLITATRQQEVVSMTFRGEYVYDEAQVASYEKQLEGAIGNVLAYAPMQGSDYDKIKFVYNTLIENTQYVLGCKDNQNVLSVFLYHESVCNGYAKATQLLLNRLGVYSTFVTGTADGEAHAWNLVQSDGAWYYLDTTWGDTDFEMTMPDTVKDNMKISCNYEYLLVDGAFLSSSHTVNKLVPLPDCVAKNDNYFVKEGLYLDCLNQDELRAIFEKAYSESKETLQLKCANGAVFYEVKQYLIDDARVFDYLQDSKEASYYVDEDIYTLCFWLFNP